jgi:hypothetical protein
VLKGELSDLGAEDGWTMDTEADHSGGRRALGACLESWGLPLLIREWRWPTPPFSSIPAAFRGGHSRELVGT